MGCDIHFLVEKVNPEDGKWDTYLEGNENFQLEIRRNYDLFAILADVRNGRGFAGYDTGDGFVPITDPRGVPEDASDKYLDYVDEWEYDGHSHSYITLTELLNFDWEGQTTKHRGFVSQDYYTLFKETGKVVSISANVGGGAVNKVSNDDMDKIISGKIRKKGGAVYYTQIEWEESYKASCADFVDVEIPALKSLAQEYNCSTDDIRIVFFFDN